MTRVTILASLLISALLHGHYPLLARDAGEVSNAQPFPESSKSYVSALQLYAVGQYRQSAKLAQATGSSRGLALAARATLAYASTLDTDGNRLSAIRHAEGLARAAIKTDPKNAEAYRHLAICLGEIARTKSAIENFLDGSPSEAKAAIDRALALDPQSPWAHAVLGGWHAEIVSKAGPRLARQTFGASRKEAKTEFETAIALEPNNPILHYEYAIALKRMDYAEDNSLLCWHLDTAASLPGRDALERAIKAKARNNLCSQQ